MTAVAAIIAAALKPPALTSDPLHNFTAQDFRQSRREGWDIVRVEDSFQLQSLIEEASPIDELDTWRLVWRQAAEGSELHRKTLDFLIDHAMSEYLAIQRACQTN